MQSRKFYLFLVLCGFCSSLGVAPTFATSAASSLSTDSPVVVEAGPERYVMPDAVPIVLRGRATGPLPFRHYRWEKLDGPDIVAEGQNTANLKLLELPSGTYVFRFTATDSRGNTDSDEMLLRVSKRPGPSPVTAYTGPDRSVKVGSEPIILRGRAEGPYPFRRYRWKLIAGAAPLPTLRGEHTANLKLSDLAPGAYLFKFTATDRQDNSDSELITLTVTDQPVVATAGPDRTVALDSTVPVRLHGSGTGPFPFRRYTWEQVSGPSVRLENQGTANLALYDLSVGTYVFRFTATDRRGRSASDETTLTVSGPTHDQLATTLPILPDGIREAPTELSVYPNPAHDQLTVRVPTGTQPTGVLLLTDLAGRQVRGIAPPAVTAAGQLVLDIEQVPAGIYTLRWQADQTYTTRVVVE